MTWDPCFESRETARRRRLYIRCYVPICGFTSRQRAYFSCSVNRLCLNDLAQSLRITEFPAADRSFTICSSSPKFIRIVPVANFPFVVRLLRHLVKPTGDGTGAGKAKLTKLSDSGSLCYICDGLKQRLLSDMVLLMSQHQCVQEQFGC